MMGLLFKLHALMIPPCSNLYSKSVVFDMMLCQLTIWLYFKDQAAFPLTAYFVELIRRTTKNVTALAPTIANNIIGQRVGIISQPSATIIQPFSPDEVDRAYDSSIKSL